MDNSFIQEQHSRMNNALSEFKQGYTNAMWSIIQGLYLINDKKLDLTKNIPHTKIIARDIDIANECEYYIAFTQKNAAMIDHQIRSRAQMYVAVSNTKSELYKSYCKYVSENYSQPGIDFTTTNKFLGEKLS